jgi:RNA polymerase sigma factor (sigma-70 family)
MNFPETDIGGGARRFPTTVWAMLQEGEEAQLQALVGRYWKPVYCFIRQSWGKGNEDAKDLTQEFFLKAVFEGGLVGKFEPGRGRFRSFLKAAVTNFLRDAAKSAARLKRGGDTRRVDLAGELPDPGTATPEQAFDAQWKRIVLARAVELVEARVKPEVFGVFRTYDLDGENVSYEDLAKRHGIRADTVKNYLTRARDEFRAAITEVVAETVGDTQDLAEEIRELFHG